jgi:hypothetical protein
MILEAHARERRDVFVTNDQKHSSGEVDASASKQSAALGS